MNLKETTTMKRTNTDQVPENKGFWSITVAEAIRESLLQFRRRSRDTDRYRPRVEENDKSR